MTTGWWNWVTMAVFFALCFALWFVVGLSKISQRPREWLAAVPMVGKFLVELVECPACFGFWEGVLFSSFMPALIPGHSIIDAIAWGLLVLFVNMVLSVKILGYTY